MNCRRVMPSEESTLVGLPPPLRGRVGERGKPRAPIEEMRGQRIKEKMDEDASRVLALRQAIERAAPLSLTLPRKGGGNPSAGASLTYEDVEGDIGVGAGTSQ
jgi:hypothetical protein